MKFLSIIHRQRESVLRENKWMPTLFVDDTFNSRAVWQVLLTSEWSIEAHTVKKKTQLEF